MIVIYFRRHFFLESFALGSAVLLSACGPVSGDATRYPDYRYRLTMEVDTPEGLKTGSSVIQVSTALSGKSNIASPGQAFYDVRGEAVVVDLGNRGAIFLTLESQYLQNWPAAALSLAQDAYQGPAPKTKFISAKQTFDESAKRILSFKGKHVLPRYYSGGRVERPKDGSPPNAYPLIVSFKDLNNPSSVILVSPDHFDKSFGEGVALRQITIERTDDPVTVGIAAKLPWLPSKKGTLVEQQLGMPLAQMPIEHRLVPKNFTSGILKRDLR